MHIKSLLFLLLLFLHESTKPIGNVVSSFTLLSAGLIATAMITKQAAHAVQNCLDQRYKRINYCVGDDDAKRCIYNASLARWKNRCIKYGVIVPTVLGGASVSIIRFLICANLS